MGFMLGGILGFLVGTLVALNKYVDMLLYPYVVAFQSLPKVALAPLFLVWFGFDMTPKVVNAALIAFFPLLVNVLTARIQNWKLEKGGVKKWGENSVPNYTNYLKYMQDQGIISEPVKVDDLITNQFIDQINNFDVAKIQEAARNWK